MRPVAAVFLFTAVVLAGCSDSEDAPEEAPTSAECLEQGLILNETAPGGPACEEPAFAIRDFEDPNHHCVVTEQRDRVHAPDLLGNPWVLGQSWTYGLNVNGEDLGSTQLVYYDDQDFTGAEPLHYMVGTPTREEALRHAIFSENPMIGRVHRILYSPHESGDHANMFNFPLCNGSTWTTVFYGEEFTLTAREASLDLPGGSDEGFRIEGESQPGSTLALSYSPAAQWFTFIDLDRADGATVDMRLEAIDTGYRGDVFFLRGQQDASIHLEAETTVPNLAPAVAQQVVAREDGSSGPYDTVGLHIVAAFAGNGAAQYSITDADGTEVWSHDMAPQQGAAVVQEIIEVPYVAGDWTVTARGIAVEAAEAKVTLDVQMVSIDDRSGSV